MSSLLIAGRRRLCTSVSNRRLIYRAMQAVSVCWGHCRESSISAEKSLPLAIYDCKWGSRRPRKAIRCRTRRQWVVVVCSDLWRTCWTSHWCKGRRWTCVTWSRLTRSCSGSTRCRRAFFQASFWLKRSSSCVFMTLSKRSREVKQALGRRTRFQRFQGWPVCWLSRYQGLLVATLLHQAQCNRPGSSCECLERCSQESLHCKLTWASFDS